MPAMKPGYTSGHHTSYMYVHIRFAIHVSVVYTYRHNSIHSAEGSLLFSYLNTILTEAYKCLLELFLYARIGLILRA